MFNPAQAIIDPYAAQDSPPRQTALSAPLMVVTSPDGVQTSGELILARIPNSPEKKVKKIL